MTSTSHTPEQRNRIWHAAMSLLHYHAPMVLWKTTDPQSEFRWAMGRHPKDTVLPERVLGAGDVNDFLYFSDIRSATVLCDYRIDDEVFACDWDQLTRQLDSVPGLRLERYRAAKTVDSDPCDAIELSIDGEDPP